MKTRIKAGVFVCGVALALLGGCAAPVEPPPSLPTQATGMVYPAEELSRPPQRIPNSRVNLAWPKELADKLARGVVVVDYVVGKEGRVIAANVVMATYPELGVAALREVAKWNFLPGEKDGQPVQAEVRFRVEYSSSGNTQWLSR